MTIKQVNNSVPENYHTINPYSMLNILPLYLCYIIALHYTHFISIDNVFEYLRMCFLVVGTSLTQKHRKSTFVPPTQDFNLDYYVWFATTLIPRVVVVIDRIFEVCIYLSHTNDNYMVLYNDYFVLYNQLCALRVNLSFSFEIVYKD